MIQLCLMFPQMMFDRKGRLISLKHVRSVPLSSSFSSRRSPAHWGCEEADESEGNAIKWSIQGSYLCCLGATDCYKRGWRRTLFLQTLLKVIQGVVTEAVLWKNNKNKIKKESDREIQTPDALHSSRLPVSLCMKWKRSRTNSCVLILWFYWSRTRCWNTVHPSRESKILWIKHRDCTR